MFVGEDSTEGVKSSLLLGLLVCLLCVCFFFSWSCTPDIQFFTWPVEGSFMHAILVNFCYSTFLMQHLWQSV